MSESNTTDGIATQSSKNPSPESNSDNTNTTTKQLDPHIQTTDLSALFTHLTALPEQIAKAVKEAVGTPQIPAKNTNMESKSEEVKSEVKTEESKPTKTKHEETPARKSFVEWWFGG